MRCRNEKCHYNDDCYCLQPDYVSIDENGECDQMFISVVLDNTKTDNDE